MATTKRQLQQQSGRLSGLASLGGLVYSTELGRTCPNCRQAMAQCVCKAPSAALAGDGVVRVWRETKGRGGKVVTVVRGLPGDVAALQESCKALKSACGTGGTVKDGAVEIQGDHRDRVMDVLRAQGLDVRRAGG